MNNMLRRIGLCLSIELQFLSSHKRLKSRKSPTSVVWLKPQATCNQGMLHGGHTPNAMKFSCAFKTSVTSCDGRFYFQYFELIFVQTWNTVSVVWGMFSNSAQCWNNSQPFWPKSHFAQHNLLYIFSETMISNIQNIVFSKSGRLFSYSLVHSLFHCCIFLYE